MRFGPGHMPLNKKQNGRQSCHFEWLKGHRVESISTRKESISTRLKKCRNLLSVIHLKKSRNFAFSNSNFAFSNTRQHNISLNGTKFKIFDSRVSVMFYQELNMQGLLVR